jgi:hypothetical protein
MLCMLQAVAGVFYLAILISRLVSLYSSASPKFTLAGPHRDHARGSAIDEGVRRDS